MIGKEMQWCIDHAEKWYLLKMLEWNSDNEEVCLEINNKLSGGIKMDNNKGMDIFTSANFFIHRLDITKVSVRTLDERKDTDWLVDIGGNVCLWFDNKLELAMFVDKVISVLKATEIEEKVNSETIS